MNVMRRLHSLIALQKPVIYKKICAANVWLVMAFLGLYSCTVVKNAPVNKKFVFANEIVVKGNTTKEESQRLTNELSNYWDDSLQVRALTKFGVFKVIKNPPLYDSINILRSQRAMASYLKSQGYYYPEFKDTAIHTTYKEEQRVKPVISVYLGKSITIDSVSFALRDSNMQHLVAQTATKSFLQKGVPYTKQVISNELDRITGLLKQNGYYNFNRDNIYALVDTTDEKLLKLTLDPFEQARLLAEFAKSKKENPKWDITISQRFDSTNLSNKQYYIGHSYYYTQLNKFFVADSAIKQRWNHKDSNNYTVKFVYENIKLKPLMEFTFLKHGTLFNENDYYKTINGLNRLGPFKQVEARFIPALNDTLDVHYFLTPEKKHNIENTGELSRNTGDLASGNLLGISGSVTYRNRNVWKQAVQSFTSLRTGLELTLVDTARTIQTFFINLNQTYSFPRFMGQKNIEWLGRNIHFLKNPIDNILNAESKRTLISFNASYTDRFQIFRLRSLTASSGYEWKNGNNVWQFRPINIELYSLDRLSGLDELIKNNPFLQLSFNTGNVVGGAASYYKSSISKKNPNVSTYFRLAAEESGFWAGMFTSLRKSVYRYAKVEAEYRHNIKLYKNEFTYRFFGGVGFNYNSNDDIGKVMPFFKQFQAGGPNSMRAWSIRQLGQGSSLLSDTAQSSFKDRFGDMQLELNVEYRFPIFSTSFLKIGSALFADIGNVWNLSKDGNNPNGEFNLSRLGKDIAIGVGTGLRFDFSYFLIRLDVGYKVKDPARTYNSGWVDLQHSGLKEYRSNGTEVRNYAFQLGIGMPF